jgi:hypothetical protein
MFEATATVLYSQPQLGMGVTFREVKSTFQSILEEWLQHSLDRQNKKPSIEDFDAEWLLGLTEYDWLKTNTWEFLESGASLPLKAPLMYLLRAENNTNNHN